MKEVIIGFPGAGAGNMSHLVGGMSARASEAMANDMKARRELINALVPKYVTVNFFEEYRNLSNKEFKKKSKEFALVYRYMETLQLQRFFNGKTIPSTGEIKRIAQTVISLCNSKQFAAMNLEDPSTDFFEIVLASYVALKRVVTLVVNKRPTQSQFNNALTLAVSDLGLRIYDMYVDNRKDTVNESETVQFR